MSADPGTPPAGPADPVGRGDGPAWRVRRAVEADVAVMHAMVGELAEFERAPELVEAVPDDLRRALFGHGTSEPRVHAHVAEVHQDGGWRVVGMAVWYVTYSTWTGRHGLWLEDLYVRPTARGLGLGRALLAALAAVCVERGYRRLEWWVLDWNTAAQGVYHAVGATPEDEWTVWRLAGDPLERLAADGQAPVEEVPER